MPSTASHPAEVLHYSELVGLCVLSKMLTNYSLCKELPFGATQSMMLQCSLYYLYIHFRRIKGNIKVGLCYWSALAQAQAETSAVAKEAFIIINVFENL